MRAVVTSCGAKLSWSLATSHLYQGHPLPWETFLRDKDLVKELTWFLCRNLCQEGQQEERRQEKPVRNSHGELPVAEKSLFPTKLIFSVFRPVPLSAFTTLWHQKTLAGCRLPWFNLCLFAPLDDLLKDLPVVEHDDA